MIWISADDQPFSIIESYEFRDLIRLCNPNALFQQRIQSKMMF